MSFTVLDPDAPQADANAYIAVQEFKDHHTDRNVADVVDGLYTDTEIQGAIVQATDFIDKRFGARFRGYRRSRSQSLEWPRLDAFDDGNYLLDPRPQQLARATAEYALLALQLGRDLAPPVAPGFGVLNPATGESTVQASGQLTRNRSKVGPIEDEQEYADQAARVRVSGNPLSPDLPSYPQADMWLTELVENRRVLRRG